MKGLKYVLLAIMVLFSLFPINNASAASVACGNVKPGQKIYWDGQVMSPGQIGKVKILKNTPMYKLIDNKPKQVKLLTKGYTYNVYTADEVFYGVGGGYYVKKDTNVSYKTPSKQTLEAEKCASSIPPKTQSINPIDLGPQVRNLSTLASKAGMDKYGNAYLYMTLQGNPAMLAVVDLNTNTVKGVFPLQHSTAAWSMDVDSNNVLWIGGTDSADLYSYDPNTGKLEDYGNILQNKSDTAIEDLTATDNYVYGSTAYGANVFAFNKKTGKTEYITSTGNGMFAKSIAVDSENQLLYVSSGSPICILKYNLANNIKTPISTNNYQSDTYVEKMRLINNLLVLKFYPSDKANIYNLSTNTYLNNDFMADSRGFSPEDNQTDEFYYTYQGNFYAYNLSTGTIRNTFQTLPSPRYAMSLDFVRLKNNPTQDILTGLIDNSGTYYLYNPITNQLTFKQVSLPAQPIILYSLFTDPTERYLYINGFMTGGLTEYDTVTKKAVQLNGVNQAESYMVFNGNIYLGAYPKARLEEVTPTEPWDQSSITTLISLEQYGQERITALTSYGSNHVFAGTYPQNTSKGGLLLDYDITTNHYQIYEDYIPNQSIISLLTDGSTIYGGTSAYANFKSTQDSAKFFRINPLNPSKQEIISLPVKASMVMSLIKGSDGNIWGTADGTIFSYNPKTNKFKTVKLLNSVSGIFGNAKLLVGKDGYIYGTIEGHLFKLNPNNMSYQFLVNSGAKEITEDKKGNIYYLNGYQLYLIPYSAVQ